MTESETRLSIGALSRATGIPIETLRTWERRYGVPQSARTDSGHRRYGLATVQRMRLVSDALKLGHRAATVLTADESSLRELIDHARPSPVTDPPDPSPQAQPSVIEVWFEHVQHLQSRAFERELRSAWSALGAQAFIEQCVGPFLRELGQRWARKELGVRHEHFASERLREFLTSQWRPLSDAATGPSYVLATLPEERHALGLHLVALTVALAGGRVLFLGADAPAQEVADVAVAHGAAGVLLSAAEGGDMSVRRVALQALLAALPPTVELRVGGRGFVGIAPESNRVESLSALNDWLRS